MWETIAWMTGTDLLRGVMITVLLALAYLATDAAVRAAVRFHRRGMARLHADRTPVGTVIPFPAAPAASRRRAG